MLENCQSARERWGGVNDLIDRWLQERQELLLLYYDIIQDSDQVEDELELRLGGQVQSLCQVLVDYVSAGHFEIYDQLIKEGQEFDDKEGIKQGRALFKEIDKTTDFCLDFNDKYQVTDDLDDIVRDLSTLGEMLAHRFESEDKMIEVLHHAHAAA